VIAAPTTSLPESIGGDRNWDYRYGWLRDAGLATYALVNLGYLMRRAISSLDVPRHANDLAPSCRSFTTLSEGPISSNSSCRLRGYKNSLSVRIVNGACSQLQLDVYGEVAMAAHSAVDGGCTLDRVEERMLAGYGRVVCRLWSERTMAFGKFAAGVANIRLPR